MWQRSQTLYLGLASILLAILTFGNAATLITPGSEPENIRYISKLPYAILLILSFAADLFATFCWGHRALQIRLCGAACVLTAAFQVWLGYDYFTSPAELVFKWTAILPAIVVILDILAIRGIYADELLVRSSARLRSAKSAAERKKAEK